jgi:hypothetical protein
MSYRREFIKQLGLNTAAAFALRALPAFIRPFKPASTARLPRSTPEEHGIASATIIDWLDAIKSGGQEFHSIMIIRHGHVVAEGWWSPFTKDDHQQL